MNKFEGGSEMAKIYLVRTGSLEGDRVVYENVVGFTTKREADTVVREAKRADSYFHQYDDVDVIDLYVNRHRWQRGRKVARNRHGRKG